jgi:hypothetical protein
MFQLAVRRGNTEQEEDGHVRRAHVLILSKEPYWVLALILRSCEFEPYSHTYDEAHDLASVSNLEVFRLKKMCI